MAAHTIGAREPTATEGSEATRQKRAIRIELTGSRDVPGQEQNIRVQAAVVSTRVMIAAKNGCTIPLETKSRRSR